MDEVAKMASEHHQIPDEVGVIADHQTDLPRLAKDAAAMRAIEAQVQLMPTTHELYRLDSRKLRLPPNSVHSC